MSVIRCSSCRVGIKLINGSPEARYSALRCHRIVEVGGGFGVTLTAILKSYAGINGTLFDRPEVTRAAQDRLDDAGVAARCEIVPGDAFDAVPRGGDLYLLSRVIHDWHDEKAVRILRSCRAAMSDDAMLVVIEAVIADRASDQTAAVLMDLRKDAQASTFSKLVASSSGQRPPFGRGPRPGNWRRT